MPQKNRMTIRSNFPAVKKGAHDAVRHARDKALDAGEDTAEKALEKVDDSRGYDLPIDIKQETLGFQSGRIFYEPWYGRFFEYGTVYIPAVGFMRKGHRKMRKVFRDDMGDNFEMFVSRRAGVRRR